MFLSLEVRSYERESPHHHHEHAQWVLPIRGEMEIDVDGCGGCIDQSVAAIVKPGAAHAQHCDLDSRFLVLDCAPTILETLHSGHLAQRIYVPIPPATRRLIEFAELIGNAQLSLAAYQLGPLLLSSLTRDIAGFSDPVEQLIARLRADPGANWSNEAMAKVAKMSMSQLHQRFRRLFDMSPQTWLTRLRLQEAQRWLRATSLPLSDIALRAGFSDQASLTRAMQRVCATTPAAYRKGHKQSG